MLAAALLWCQLCQPKKCFLLARRRLLGEAMEAALGRVRPAAAGGCSKLVSLEEHLCSGWHGRQLLLPKFRGKKGEKKKKSMRSVLRNGCDEKCSRCMIMIYCVSQARQYSFQC